MFSMSTFIARRSSALISRLTREGARRGQAATYYRSQYSIDKLYPPQSTKESFVSQTSPTPAAVSSKDGDFNGFIPIEEMQVTYSGSTDPTAFCLKVNDVNPNVEIRFHVHSANWIPEVLKPKLLLAESDLITKDGYLVVTSSKTRSQMLNQADCLDRLRAMIRQCATKTRSPPTQDELELIKQRQSKARALLREKKSNSMKA